MPRARSLLTVKAVVISAFLLLITATVQGDEKSGPQLDADKLFDANHLMSVEIEVAKEDWASLCAQSRNFAEALGKLPAKSPFTYFKANVIIDGVRVENVGVRKKGFLGSLDGVRPSLKIDFSEYKKQTPIKGIDRLTLNNNKQDRSLVSQYLTYKLFADTGQPSPRCSHAKVTVNGQSLGIYSHVESFKKPMMKRVFGDSSGDLFEGTIADFLPNRVQKFEAKTKKTKHTVIEKITQTLDVDDIDLDRLGELVDLDAFIKFWATESLIGFWDGYSQNQNNFFVYRNPANSKLYFMPWGADSAFVNGMPIPPYYIRVKSVQSQAVLANRLFRIPETRDAYKATLDKLLADAWVEEKFLEDLDRIEAKLKDHVHSSQKDFPGALTKARDFIKKRRGVFQKEFEKWPIVLTHGPRPPVYFKEMGSVQGTFTTKWNTDSPKAPESNGAAEIKFVLDGEAIKFKQIGVSAEPKKTPGPRDKSGRRKPTIVFTGLRESDGKQFIIGFETESEGFEAANGEAVPVGGIVIEGKLGFLNPKGFKMISGTARFKAAKREEGAEVQGSIDLKVVKMAGGQAKYLGRKDPKKTEVNEQPKPETKSTNK
jgi:spore coat protein CotH